MTLKRALVTTVTAVVLVGLGQPATAQTPELLTVEFYSPAVDREEHPGRARLSALPW